MRKRAVAGWIALGLLIVAGIFYYWTEQIADPGGLQGTNRIEIRAGHGGVDVVGTNIPDVQVSIDGQRSEAAGAQVRIDRKRDYLLVQIDDIPRLSRAQVRVPRDASIAVTMSAGQLTIEGIEGGDIAAVLRSGEMTIRVGEASNFRSANAFVLSGKLQAPAFQVEKAGVWRGMYWSGPGTHTLKAHVTAGLLVLK
jgi:hypothetical protein